MSPAYLDWTDEAEEVLAQHYSRDVFVLDMAMLDPIPEAQILQQAMSSGALETPFQYSFIVTEGGFAELNI